MEGMSAEQPHERLELITADLAEFMQTAAEHSWPLEPQKTAGPKTYRLAFDRQPIQLGCVEFHILLFLASRPYHAFTRQAISKAVRLEQVPLDEKQVDEYIATLRDQLGVLHDYVQSVPYIGYRFKP